MNKKRISPKPQIQNLKFKGWSNFLSSVFCLLSSAFCLLSSCDKIDQPFEKSPNINPVDSGLFSDTTIVYDTSLSVPNVATRVILIEEFTGHTCTNCPEGAREVQRIDSLHDAQIIPVSIHAGYFAIPHTPPDTAYLTDFRTTEGEEYNSTFAVWGNPSAMISRTDDGTGNLVRAKSDWEPTVNLILNDVPQAKIDIMNLYNDSLRIIKGKVSVQWLQTAAGSYKVQAYLIQDHITDWQLDGAFNNPNYDHRHVLRKALFGTWGSPVSTSNASDTASFEYSLQLNSNWVAANCEVIAFIYNNSTYEVLQASEAEIVP